MTQLDKSLDRKSYRWYRSGLLASGAGLVMIKVVNALLGFATVTVFARFMPPDNYGIYILALTFAQFLAMPLQMGLPQLLTREIAVACAENRPAVVKGLRLWSQRMIVLGGLALGFTILGLYAVVIAAGWPILQEASWPLVLVTAALVPVIAQMKKLMGLLAGFRKPAQSRVPDGLVRPGLLLFIGAVGLATGLLDETGLLVIYLAAALCAVLVGQALVRRADPLPHPGEAEYHSANWWRSLGPLTLFVAAGTINTYADILMIGAMESSASVAHYRIASQIAAIALLVQVAVNAVIGPRIAAFNVADDYDRMQGMAVRGCRLAFGATLLFSGLLYKIGVDGFVALLGPEYAPVYPLAVALAFGTAVQTFFGGATWILNMTRREKSSATYALISAGGNILLNLALIPVLGAFGAVIATVATNLLMQALAWNRIRHDLGIRSDAFARVLT